MNALNAALAVIKWKKVRGFYGDRTQELNCEYVIDGNRLIKLLRSRHTFMKLHQITPEFVDEIPKELDPAYSMSAVDTGGQTPLRVWLWCRHQYPITSYRMDADLRWCIRQLMAVNWQLE